MCGSGGWGPLQRLVRPRAGYLLVVVTSLEEVNAACADEVDNPMFFGEAPGPGA